MTSEPMSDDSNRQDASAFKAYIDDELNLDSVDNSLPTDTTSFSSSDRAEIPAVPQEVIETALARFQQRVAEQVAVLAAHPDLETWSMQFQDEHWAVVAGLRQHFPSVMNDRFAGRLSEIEWQEVIEIIATATLHVYSDLPPYFEPGDLLPYLQEVEWDDDEDEIDDASPRPVLPIGLRTIPQSTNPPAPRRGLSPTDYLLFALLFVSASLVIYIAAQRESALARLTAERDQLQSQVVRQQAEIENLLAAQDGLEQLSGSGLE
jgi:hypothetical protein